MNFFHSPAPIFQNSGLAIIRICIGVFLFYHGYEIFDRGTMEKYLSWDIFKNDNGEWLIYSGKAAELIAGILFFLGLFTRYACMITIGVMAYIAFVIGNGIIWYDDQHSFLFILLSMVFIFTGPGALAIDNIIFKKK